MQCNIPKADTPEISNIYDEVFSWYSWRLPAVNYFPKKVTWWMFDTSLTLYINAKTHRRQILVLLQQNDSVLIMSSKQTLNLDTLSNIYTYLHTYTHTYKVVPNLCRNRVFFLLTTGLYLGKPINTWEIKATPTICWGIALFFYKKNFIRTRALNLTKI